MPSEEQIYKTPGVYDLEHSAPEADVGFFVGLARKWQPRRVLELACGNGRISVPMACELGRWGGSLVGLDTSPEMLQSGQQKAASSPCAGLENVELVRGDMRHWVSPAPFDLVICPCASMSHLLALEDQLSAWNAAFHNLNDGGRFIVAEQMASLPTLAESQQSPPRAVLEIDSDTSRCGGKGCERLVRYRATRYHAHEQLASVRFLYDKLWDDASVSERFLSDYDCHVFYPRELQLLFLHAGFEIEHIWGDYNAGPLTEVSRQLIIAGRKPAKSG